MLNFDSIVTREWLQGRYHLLEIAAMLDRMDQAAKREGLCAEKDQRVEQLRKALDLIAHTQDGSRAERILMMLCNTDHQDGRK